MLIFLNAHAPAEELRRYVLKGNYELEQKSNAFNLGAMFTSGLDLMEQLSNFGYRVLYAPEQEGLLQSATGQGIVPTNAAERARSSFYAAKRPLIMGGWRRISWR